MGRTHKFKFSGLTHDRMVFSNYIVDGMAVGESYAKAISSKGSKKSCQVEGSKWLNEPEVAAYVEKLRAKTEEYRAASRAYKRDKLFFIMEENEDDPRVVIQAITADNLMTGDNKPQEVQVFGLAELLQQVRKGSK